MIKTHIGEIKNNYAKFDLALICEEKYKSLKPIDMVTYTMLKNQESLSINSVRLGNKRYVDKNGYVFIEISQIKLAKILNTTRPTLKASLDRLQTCELIEVVFLGNNKCNRIYVGEAESTTTLGDYIKNIGLELDEDLEEFEPTIKVVKADDIEEGNKKADAPQQAPAKETNKNKSYNPSVSQNKTKYNGKKTSQHIINQRGLENYDAQELEKRLLENQKQKWDW